MFLHNNCSMDINHADMIRSICMINQIAAMYTLSLFHCFCLNIISLRTCFRLLSSKHLQICNFIISQKHHVLENSRKILHNHLNPMNAFNFFSCYCEVFLGSTTLQGVLVCFFSVCWETQTHSHD